MSKAEEVQHFLIDFKVKLGIWGVFFREDRSKNAQALLDLEISPAFREEILMGLVKEDYSEGPIDDTLYGVASLWVFGKIIKKQEVYIKISMGSKESRVICISFHIAEHKKKYHLKSK